MLGSRAGPWYRIGWHGMRCADGVARHSGAALAGRHVGLNNPSTAAMQSSQAHSRCVCKGKQRVRAGTACGSSNIGLSRAGMPRHEDQTLAAPCNRCLHVSFTACNAIILLPQTQQVCLTNAAKACSRRGLKAAGQQAASNGAFELPGRQGRAAEPVGMRA